MMLNLPSAGGTEAGVSEPLLITPCQLAAMLQVSKRTLWRMLSAKLLPAPVRVGGIVRWRIEEIDRWISGGCPKQS